MNYLIITGYSPNYIRRITPGSLFDYLKEDATVGVKASINIENNILRIIGEKVTFINPVT
jgi:hypothetical protein